MQPHPPTGHAGMAALPREIIRWIQTLSLSKTLKHPKRDFANGFLVAEIASRYIPAIDMTLFDNVQSTTKKLANWKALQKCLARGGAPQIPEQLVHDVMNAKDGAGDELLTMLYSQFTSKPPPGTQPKGTGAGNVAPEPQPLEHIPQFVKNISASGAAAGDGSSSGGGSGSGGNGGGLGEQATKQLSAMAAEQLRAAELELMKQKSESDLKNEILGLSDESKRDPNNNQQQQGRRGGAGLHDDDARAAEQLAARQAQKARLLRQPAVPQTTTQGQIRAVDLEAEKQEKAVLFNNVSVRQLSGAALQRFGFRDRSQSPSGRGAGSSPLNNKKGGGARGTSSSGTGGVGSSIHVHLSNLFDRFVAEYFSSNTTWNPPADSSPLSYFIENCSNPNVISPSFKANIWSFLYHEARSTAAILATAPIDTLYFVAHFANVNVEGSAPRPGDPLFTDLAKPKFFGADAFDSTLYCHAVLGALRDMKSAAAETILRRYAFPAILPVLFRNFDTTQQIAPLSITQQRAASLSARRALFALSGLSLGNQQPRNNNNSNSLTSSLKCCFSNTTSKTSSAVDQRESFEEKIQNNTVSIHQFIEVIYDSILTNYESTVAYSTKIFSADLANALSHQKVSQNARDVEFFNALELLCNSIRGEVTVDQMVPADVTFPESLSLLMVHNIERGFAHESSAVQEAALRALIAMIQVGSLGNDRLHQVGSLALSQLRSNLLPALREPRGVFSSNVASGSMLMELLRLLCVVLRCSSSSSSENNSKNQESEQAEQLRNNQNNRSTGSIDDDQREDNKISSCRREALSIAVSCVTQLHHLALRDVERLALLSALASGLSNFDYTPPVSSASGSGAPSKITVSNASGTLENTVTYTDERLGSGAGAGNNVASMVQKSPEEQQELINVHKIATWCVETLLALPPPVLESFANSGGSFPRALPSIMASSQDRLVFAAPLDYSRWNITAIGACLASRFCIASGPAATSASLTSAQYKIPSALKTGSAGVLKLPTPPSPQTKPEEYTKFITPFKALILLFTLFSGKVSNAREEGMNGSSSCATCNICRPHRPEEDAVVWWNVLASGFAHEVKKLLLYYDAARKGPASLAPRKDPESEATHEIYVQAGRAALFILGKFYQNISNSVPSSVQQNFGAFFTGLGSRVSQPASKIGDDDRVMGQLGLEVASKSIEWLMTSVVSQHSATPSGRGSVLSGGGGGTAFTGSSSINVNE